MKKKKLVYRILVIALFLVMVMGIYAYKEYNRKNIDLASTKATFSLTDMELINAYASDQKASNQKYLGKVLELSGNIKKIDTDANGYHTIILGNNSNMNSVRCSIDSAYNKSANNLSEGSNIVIKGICTGYNADDLGLGSDIILNRSIAIKK